MFSRTVKEWEKYRNRADNQYVELMHRVNYLADEVRLYYLNPLDIFKPSMFLGYA